MHRLDQLCPKKPAKLLDSKWLRLTSSSKQIWAGYFYQTVIYSCVIAVCKSTTDTNVRVILSRSEGSAVALPVTPDVNSNITAG
jgi:hypothetical protein